MPEWDEHHHYPASIFPVSRGKNKVKQKFIKKQTCSFSVGGEEKEMGEERGREVEITIILNHYMGH